MCFDGATRCSAATKMCPLPTFSPLFSSYYSCHIPRLEDVPWTREGAGRLGFATTSPRLDFTGVFPVSFPFTFFLLLRHFRMQREGNKTWDDGFCVTRSTCNAGTRSPILFFLFLL